MSAAIKEYLPCPLNRTEVKVLQLLANGLHTKDLPTLLGITLNTVNGAVQTAKQKARANHKTHLVSIALRHGWVD